MDYKNAFQIVSTGKRVSSVYAEPELSVYPATGRLRLTKAALTKIGAAEGSRLMILQSDAYLAFVEDEEGKCKVDKNGNFTSAVTVKPLGLEENTSFRKFETANTADLGLDEQFGDKPVVIFDLSESIKADEAEEEEETEAEEVEE